MSQQDPDLTQQAPPVAPAATVEAPVAQPTVTERQIDPSYVAQLEQFARQQQAELNRYEAVKGDIDWMLEDETRLDGVRRYKNAYEEAAKPKFDPTIEPVMEYVKSELAPVREWVDTQKQADLRRQQAERDTFIGENRKYQERLVAEKKLTPEQAWDLAGHADYLAAKLGRNVGLEEAYKRLGEFAGAIGGKTEAAQAPVLRSEAGAIGVPGPSEADNKRWVTDFHGSLTDALRAEKRTA